MFRRRGNLLGLFVVCTGLTGCLLAPPIERNDAVNHPFTVDAARIQPSPEADHTLSLQLGQSQQFFAIDAVSDPDGDDIFTFWYVRNPSTDEILDDRPFMSYTFTPCDRRFGSDGSDLPPQVFIEVLASDRDLLQLQQGPDGDDVVDGDVVDEVACEQKVGVYGFPCEANVVTLGWWWVTIAPGGSCP